MLYRPPRQVPPMIALAHPKTILLMGLDFRHVTAPVCGEIG
jgi:hypothetical protein